MNKKLLLYVVVCGIVICASPFLGRSLSTETGQFVLWQLRFPRTILGILVGFRKINN